jgi:predicted small metal-binding protein
LKYVFQLIVITTCELKPWRPSCQSSVFDDKYRFYRRGFDMTRQYIDCRDFPSAMNCSVALSADSEKELLDAAVQHAVAVHQHQDTPELRTQLKQLFKNGTPPISVPASRGAAPGS